MYTIYMVLIAVKIKMHKNSSLLANYIFKGENIVSFNELPIPVYNHSKLQLTQLTQLMLST
jgi:hypothetical protein